MRRLPAHVVLRRAERILETHRAAHQAEERSETESCISKACVSFDAFIALARCPLVPARRGLTDSARHDRLGDRALDPRLHEPHLLHLV